MTKRYLTDTDIKNFCGSIVREIGCNYWRPSVIVAPGRGGFLPGLMLSHYYECPLIPLRLSTRDFVTNDPDAELKAVLQKSLMHRSVLVVDDINDSGKTMNRIHNLYQTLDYPADDVRFAALLEKSSSSFSAHYVGQEIHEDREQEWVVFPYEDWWRR